MDSFEALKVILKFYFLTKFILNFYIFYLIVIYMMAQKVFEKYSFFQRNHIFLFQKWEEIYQNILAEDG